MNKYAIWLTTVFILVFGAGSVFGQSEEAKRHLELAPNANYMDSVIMRTDPPSAFVTRHDVNVKGEIISIEPPQIKESVTVSISWGAPVEGDRQPWSADFNERTEVVNTYELVDRNKKLPEAPPPLFEESDREAEKQTAKAKDINGKNREDGVTPLHEAASKGQSDVAELLIAQGADINAKDQHGLTPLHYAADVRIAGLLIAKGADINAKDKSGFTPLHYADTGNAELLIARGADINAKNIRGGTPLHRAASLCSAEVAELLINKGADVNARDNEGKTPMDEAKSSFSYQGQAVQKEMIALLKKHGAR